MKKSLIILIVLIFSLMLFSCKTNGKNEVERLTSLIKNYKTQSDEKEISSEDAVKYYYYAMGNYYAANFSAGYPDMDLDSFVEGVRAFQNGIELDMDALNESVENYIEYRNKKLAAENIVEAEEFLANNASEEGVITTESGLQYKVLQEGEGAKPSENSNVTVIYELSLLDGDVIDSSYGEEVEFNLSDVIPGFREAVMLMSPGASVKIWVHPSLGYGEEGNQIVEPQTLLIFDIQLVSFKDAEVEDE